VTKPRHPVIRHQRLSLPGIAKPLPALRIEKLHQIAASLVGRADGPDQRGKLRFLLNSHFERTKLSQNLDRFLIGTRQCVLQRTV